MYDEDEGDEEDKMVILEVGGGNRCDCGGGEKGGGGRGGCAGGGGCAMLVASRVAGCVWEVIRSGDWNPGPESLALIATRAGQKKQHEK